MELLESVDDSTTVSEAQSLVNHMEDFSFPVSLIVWHDLLFEVNLVSKTLQVKETVVPSTMTLLQRCENFLETGREKGLTDSIITAKEIAEELEMEPSFPIKRRRSKKNQFSYEGSDEVTDSPEDLFRREVFLRLVDNVSTSLRERSAQLKKYHNVWGFLYNMNKLPEKEYLKESCQKLQDFLTVDNVSDINGKELYNEILHVRSVIHDADQVITPIKALQKIKSNDQKDLFTNWWITLRIQLTVPITVASTERSFSKLKLIQTYLRSTMTEERLSALAVLEIENEEAKKLDFKEILKSFASANARKIPLGV